MTINTIEKIETIDTIEKIETIEMIDTIETINDSLLTTHDSQLTT